MALHFFGRVVQDTEKQRDRSCLTVEMASYKTTIFLILMLIMTILCQAKVVKRAKHKFTSNEEKEEDVDSKEDSHNVKRDKSTSSSSNALSNRAIFDLVLNILNTFQAIARSDLDKAKEKEKEKENRKPSVNSVLDKLHDKI